MSWHPAEASTSAFVTQCTGCCHEAHICQFEQKATGLKWGGEKQQTVVTRPGKWLVCVGGGVIVDNFGVESEKSGRVEMGWKGGRGRGRSCGLGLEGEGSLISTKRVGVGRVGVCLGWGGGGVGVGVGGGVMGVGVATGLWVKPDVGHDSAEMRRPDQEHRTLSY